MIIVIGWAEIGFDTITPVSVDSFKCMMKYNYSYYIGRVWKSYAAPDYVGIQNIKNARAGIFICCQQVKDFKKCNKLSIG